MTRKRVYERPTPRLVWVDGVLRQEWRIQWRDEDTMGAANPETFEWRDVPVLPTPQESAEAKQ
jgi:hypothetical protein